MKRIQILTFFLLIILIPYPGTCAILHVPANYSSIQEAIDASVDGDIVLVEPNTYYEHLILSGKNIILCSGYFTTGNSAFIANTILDGSNTGRVITIDQNENSSCQIIGFTIQHGNSPADPDPFATNGGGGIFIWEASPKIIHCVIQNNYAFGYGGGLCITGSNSAAKVLNSTIQNNWAESFGGGVFMGDCSPEAEISNCIISHNTNTNTDDFNGGGGGVNLYHRGKLVNCLITNNSAPNSPVGGGGVHCDWGDDINPSIFVDGCTIVNNTALNWGGVSYVIYGGEFRNCIIWGNTSSGGSISNYDGNSFQFCCIDPLPPGTGNISSDPAFIDTISGNFRLQSGSACINAGDNAYSSQSFDLDGNQRIFDNTIDIGAYEYGAGAGVDVQIGSGFDISQTLPIYACYNYNYSQQIYLGSEIVSGGGAAGLISKIRFYYSGDDFGISSWNNWAVYLGNTDKAEFTSKTDWVPVSSLTSVFSGIFPDPVSGTWLEISLPTPFYYSGSNIVIAVDENVAGYDCTAEWGSFYTGSPRGIIAYDDNIHPNPTSPPEANFDPDYSIPQVQLVMNTAVGTLSGYVTEQPVCSLPMEGATIIADSYSTTSDADGFYQLHLPVGTYNNIIALYLDANQTITTAEITQGNTTTQDFCLTGYFAPPVDLQASLSGPALNNVHLTWLAPGSLPDQWIHWDNGLIYGGLGYNAPTVFSVASRWPVSDIAPYGGKYLEKIRFVITEATASYTLKVWKGADASTLLLSQVVPDPIINGWNEVTLASPILIDGTEELWFGYEIVQTTGYPAGLASGPAVAGKGDMINSGGEWFSMKEAWNFEFNWTLQGFVSENATLAPHQIKPMVQNPLQAAFSNIPLLSQVKPQVKATGQTIASSAPANLSMSGNSRLKSLITAPLAPMASITGYNVYRDNVKIADNIADLFYDDSALPKGGYEYEVSAQYVFGESVTIGPLHVDIYTCFPPTDLMVSNSTLTTTTAHLSWTPSTLSPNQEWKLEWGLAGFIPGTGTTVTVNLTPEYSLSGLTPGAEYDFYVSTYCSAEDASVWARKSFRTHYFDCPAGAVAEAEVCGTNTNGCDLVPPAFETISCDETICGTSWLTRSHRDSDWFAFTLTEPADVILTGKSEFTSFMGIGSAPCPSALFYQTATVSPEYNTSITTQIASAGTYYIYVAPSYAEQVVCDSLSHYWIKITCNNCLTPTALSATNITSNSALLGWTSTAILWNIEWGPFGFAQGTGTMINGNSSNPYELTGLTMGHAYSYYVQSDCGGGAQSSWAGPFSFYLPCPPVALPYVEDFTTHTAGITPQCWQTLNYGGPGNWIVDNTNNAGGVLPELKFVSGMPFFSGRSFLASPVLNTTGQASLNLSFKHYISANNPGTSCEIWTTSNGGNSWSSVWTVSQNGTLGPETKNLSINTADVGSANFQFAFAVNGNSWEINSWEIDDITLTGIPQTGTLEGHITKCSDNTAIAGVAVTAGPNSTTTGISGFYQFLNIPVGTHDVEFSMAGYVTKSVPAVQVLNGLVTTLDTCLTLTGPSAITNVQNETISIGQSQCYDATQTITVAGGGTSFIVQDGGSATMIAGINIDYLPGTLIYPGGYMSGKIAPTGPFCGTKSASFVTAGNNSKEIYPDVVKKSGFRVYPNPTNGIFRLELTGDHLSEQVRVTIYGVYGDRVLSQVLSGEKTHEFSLAGKAAGIYFIKVVEGGQVFTSKLIKTK